MTLWIRIDANMAGNPNVWKMATVRGLSAVTVVGHLVSLFGNVAQHAPSGDVRELPDALLEQWAGWTGEPATFAQSFRELFVTDGVIDGWEKRQGALIDRANKERERTARRRSANKTQTVREQTADENAVRNGTVRNGSKKPATAGKPREKQEPAPWMGLMFAAWTLGTLPQGSATLLRPVVAAVGEAETARRLTAYCETVDPRYANVRDFVAKHAVHAEQLAVDPRTGVPNAIGARALGGRR